MKHQITCGTVRFIDIPEYFLEKYSGEINAWAENLSKVGLVKSFFLREGYLSDLSTDPELGAEMIVVKLKCRPWRGGVEIAPLEERDEVLIEKHCKKLQAAKIPSNAVLQEPARPWLPFVPKVVQ